MYYPDWSNDYDDDTEQDINVVDTDLFSSSEDEAEIRRRENLRARDAIILIQIGEYWKVNIFMLLRV